MSESRTLSNFIGGRFLPAASGAVLDDVGPATGRVLARVPRSGAADVDAAVRAARHALDTGWSRSSIAERARLCETVADRIEARAGELAELESLDTGKPVKLARIVDIPRAVLNFRFFAGAVRHDATACHEMEGGAELHAPPAGRASRR